MQRLTRFILFVSLQELIIKSCECASERVLILRIENKRKENSQLPDKKEQKKKANCEIATNFCV